jgi:hypothetical protein
MMISHNPLVIYKSLSPPLPLHVALQPNVGYGLLVHEVFEITHTTRHSR